MYVPGAFAVDPAEAKRFMETVEFAQLVTVRDGVPVATHLPVEFLVDSDNCSWIYSHMARGNPQWRDFDPEREALLIAQGRHGYISPAWYEKRDVPTWNYRAAHVYGVPEQLDDGDFRAMLERLVARHESGRPDPVALDDYPAGMIEAQMRAAVGFRLRVTRIEAAFKLSQNKPGPDYRGVLEGLRREGREDLARIMRSAPTRGGGRR